MTQIYEHYQMTQIYEHYQRPDYSQRRQGKSGLDSQSLTFKVVYDVEYPEAAPIRELVVHEIHGPHLIRSDRLL